MSTELFPIATYTVQPGDLWRLGNHLLLCSDSTKQDQVERIMSVAGGKVDAIITDPPYGELKVSWDIPTMGFIPYLAQVTKETATCMLFCSLPYGFTLQQAMMQAGWHFRFDMIWQKGNAGFQVSKFQPLVAHEHIWAYEQERNEHGNIFAYSKDVKATSLTFNGFEAGEQEDSWGDKCRTDKKSQLVYAIGGGTRQGRIDGKRWLRSVFSLLGRKKQEMPEWERSNHPTQKDAYLVEKLVRCLTEPGEMVYDPFCGSGTTIWACERSGRRCITIEQSPVYCEQEILRSWQKISTVPPVLLSRQVA
jgi:DNA modification methylase